MEEEVIVPTEEVVEAPVAEVAEETVESTEEVAQLLYRVNKEICLSYYGRN